MINVSSKFELIGGIMKQFIFGLIIGIIISGGVVWAAITTNILLVDSNGVNFGTTDNPMYVTTS